MGKKKKEFIEEGFFATFQLNFKNETWYKTETFKTKEELESFVKEKKLKKIKWFHSPRAGTIKRVYDDLFRKNTFSTKTGRWFLMTKRDLAWFEKIDERNFKGEYQELFSKIKRDYTAKADIIAILGKKD